jgi:hypothetical protein
MKCRQWHGGNEIEIISAAWLAENVRIKKAVAKKKKRNQPAYLKKISPCAIIGGIK